MSLIIFFLYISHQSIIIDESSIPNPRNFNIETKELSSQINDYIVIHLLLFLSRISYHFNIYLYIFIYVTNIKYHGFVFFYLLEKAIINEKESYVGKHKKYRLLCCPYSVTVISIEGINFQM